jgi:hypothetical protein
MSPYERYDSNKEEEAKTYTEESNGNNETAHIKNDSESINFDSRDEGKSIAEIAWSRFYV